MDHMRESQAVLTRDENIFILTYIIIQSGIPDLASQLELITSFASEYMQEGPDGSQISQTYLQFIACLRYLDYMDIASFMEQDNARRTGSAYEMIDILDANKSGDSINDSVNESTNGDQSMLGLSMFMKIEQKKQ